MKISLKHIPLLFIIVIISVAGCGESKELTEQRAKLELAEIKGDLDSIYLSLSRLSESGDKQAKSKLVSITMAVETRERMELALSDHDHEEALIYASELLKLVPNNKKAKKVVRESGQIFYYLLAAKTLLSQYESVDEEFTVDPQKVSLDSTLSDEDREKSLIKRSQELLAQLDYDAGSPDGIAGKKTVAAIQKFQEDKEVDATGVTTVALANMMYDSLAEREEEELKYNEKMKYAERLFEGFGKAREYAKKARDLDPHFKGSLDFENTIEGAHASLVYIVGVGIYETGQALVSGSATTYSHISELLSLAVSTSYLSVQSAWSSIEEDIGDLKEKLEPSLDKMENTGRLLATYEDGSAKEFVDATLDYIRVVRKTVDAFLVPKGNYRDYSKAGNEATTQYIDARDRLNSSLPTSISIEESFAGLVKVVSEYNVYKNDETPHIIEENENLYESI